jgi:NADPH:quinone reductase-like Zn-dependent oxidoreductase
VITTEAWVLYSGNSQDDGPAELQREEFSFPDIAEDEVLAEPILGCWEGNMTHSLQRMPIDICRQRREKKIIIGNAGVVRVTKVGPKVTRVREDDVCIVAPIGRADDKGAVLKVWGYDDPYSLGMLAKTTKLTERQLAPLPAHSKHTVEQWAAFCLRYPTAWTNWRVALGAWRLQSDSNSSQNPFVWGWGGGVSFAELSLARMLGCQTAMIASREERLEMIRRVGITPVDRRDFIDLCFDEDRYRSDRDFKRRYLKAESAFLQAVRAHTDGQGASIFIDNIGEPVYRATLKALGRHGVIATAGWRCGPRLSLNRAAECIAQHIHVHTHGCKYSDGVAAVEFAEQTGWLPPVGDSVFAWEGIPQLAREFARGAIDTYFPIFAVNPEVPHR